MSQSATTLQICQICKKHKSPHGGMVAELIRPSLLEFIKKEKPDLDSKGFICLDDLGEFRKDYVKEVLEDEIGELSALDQEVIESLEQHEILSSDLEKQFEKKLTFGERLSDHIAEFGGSWKFLITFGVPQARAGERPGPGARQRVGGAGAQGAPLRRDLPGGLAGYEPAARELRPRHVPRARGRLQGARRSPPRHPLDAGRGPLGRLRRRAHALPPRPSARKGRRARRLPRPERAHRARHRREPRVP